MGIYEDTLSLRSAAREARRAVPDGRQGVTLVELLVVIALIALFALITAGGSFGGARNRSTLNAATSQLAATLREAGSRSVAQSRETAWGVRLDNTVTSAAFYALFASSTYSPAAVIAHYGLPAGVFYATSTLPGGSAKDVVFAQLTGATTSTSVGLYMPTAPGTSTLITITSSGLVQY